MGKQYLRIVIALVSLSAMTYGSPTGSASNDGPQLLRRGTCDHPLSFYSRAHYTISAVRIVSPFDYSRTVRKLTNDALASTNLYAGNVFSSESVTKARRAIQQRLNRDGNAVNLPVMVNVVTAAIENCSDDAQPPSLEVVYEAFSTWAPFVLTRTFEDQSSQSDDPATASGVRHKKLEVLPNVGYDATARMFGGGRASITGRMVKFDLDALASSQMFSCAASFSGKHTWEDGWIRTAEWQSGPSYDDTPTGINRIKRARLTAQMSANSAPFGPANSVLRFGVSIGGGHDQSNLPNDQLPPGSLSSSPIGEIKMYVGTSGHAGRGSFKLSYGIQLGEVHSGLGIDFAKHIIDGSYNPRFLLLPHKPLDIHSRLAAGWIQNLGAVPAPERFFGGNSEQQFLLGDSWQIRDAPVIRSIPRNQLNRLSPDIPIGGQNFVSVNVTVAVPAWNRPLMPEEIRANPDFRDLLRAELKSAQKTLESYWISKDKAVPNVLSESGEATALIRALRMMFDGAKTNLPRGLSDRFSDCDFQLSLAEGFAKILDTEKNSSKRFVAMKSLIAEGDDGSVDNLIGCIHDLRSIFRPDAADSMVEKLTSVQIKARTTLSAVDKTAAQKKANGDMTFINQTVNTLVNEMNFFSVSPIAILDMARIGPQVAAAGGGFRYGLGGGVRLMLLDTIRLDAGYALNPHPEPWEGRGAAFFSLEVVPLFR